MDTFNALYAQLNTVPGKAMRFIRIASRLKGSISPAQNLVQNAPEVPREIPHEIRGFLAAETDMPVEFVDGCWKAFSNVVWAYDDGDSAASEKRWLHHLLATHPTDDSRPDEREDGPDFTDPVLRGGHSVSYRPEYESIAETLLDALWRRFSFVMPPSPESFVARATPKQFLQSQDLPTVMGMLNIDLELASQKGLEQILCTFFGQCLDAQSFENIDRTLLDCQLLQPNCPFEIKQELLKSMRNPSQGGCGIESEVLLLPRATDLVEVIRQRWGPEIKDVVAHLLARGIPFWLAYVSTEILPEARPVPAHGRIPSGIGFRSHQHTFDRYDYDAYIVQRDCRLLHAPRGRIALQYGGVMARLARSEISDEDFFRPFNEDIYNVGDCLWDGTSHYAYWHDALSDDEIDLLCGVYCVGTGMYRRRAMRKLTTSHLRTTI
ncbi:hypothetical protein C8R46DRAFT_1079416 [Mycena filopes]|nr:hypothetical protein C8R46DRAFT_1079416 [Mycena filopes]